MGLLAVVAAAAPGCTWVLGPQVAVVGDSITRQVEGQLSGRWGDWRVAAVNGRTAGGMEAESALLATTEPDQAVVNLGTNDALQRVPLEQTERALTAIVDGFAAAGTRCVHLVTISTRLPSFAIEPEPPQEAARINEWLRSLDAARGDVALIDWDAEVSAPDGPGLLEEDMIHPGPAGEDRLVELIGDAVDRGCLPRG